MPKYALVNTETNEVYTVMISNSPISYGNNIINVLLDENSTVGEGWKYINGQWQEPETP
jgi:hypothetical protein